MKLREWMKIWLDGEFNIPEDVTEIISLTFYNCMLAKRINIGPLVTTIGGSAFQVCRSLIEFNIPKTVEKIGSYAFWGCNSITKINSDVNGELNIPNGVKTIDSYAFCGLANIIKIRVPDTVTSMGSSVFGGCNAIEELELPFVNLSATDTNCFGILFYSKNNNDYVPSSIRKVTITSQNIIPDLAFEKCKYIEEINVPATVTSIGYNAFYNCSALSRLNSDVDGEFNIPEGVTVIRSSIFYNCILAKRINVGPLVTTIAYSAFESCKLLTEFNIPKSSCWAFENEYRFGIFDWQDVQFADINFECISKIKVNIFPRNNSDINTGNIKKNQLKEIKNSQIYEKTSFSKSNYAKIIKEKK